MVRKFGKHRLILILIGLAVVVGASLPTFMTASCLTRQQTPAEVRALENLRAQTRGDRLSQQCAESMETPRLNGRRMALYLTPEGLGVFNQDWKASSPKECAVRTNLTVNPVILSYRDLEPFMKPGPWRDELLNQPSPRTP